MTSAWQLDTLPVEVLLLIFDCCDVPTLLDLSEVCRRFQSIIEKDSLWLMNKIRLPVATNQISKFFRERCNPLLTLRKKFDISENWREGRYTRNILIKNRRKSMPWLQLTRDTLWCSGGNQLIGLQRERSGTRKTCSFIERNIPYDISRFVVKDSYIVSGHVNGGLTVWTFSDNRESNYVSNINYAHSSDINCVDAFDNRIASGDSDGVIKLWNMDDGVIHQVPIAYEVILDKIWSMSVEPVSNKLAIGSAGTSSCLPLHIFDIERLNVERVHPLYHTFRRGAGILDIVWENPNSLLTCGYDTFIRKWDLRTGRCVRSWVDPTDATVYCLSTDNSFTMLAGTQFNSKAVLWDQRQSEFVQLYFMSSGLSSPVYSLAFDSTRLYSATDAFLIELNFTKSNNPEKNYRYFFNSNLIGQQANVF